LGLELRGWNSRRNERPRERGREGQREGARSPLCLGRRAEGGRGYREEPINDCLTKGPTATKKVGVQGKVQDSRGKLERARNAGVGVGPGRW